MTMEQFEGLLKEFGIVRTNTFETVAPHSAKKLDNGTYSMEQYTNYLTHSMKQQKLF
jgi:putative heme degradation protein